MQLAFSHGEVKNGKLYLYHSYILQKKCNNSTVYFNILHNANLLSLCNQRFVCNCIVLTDFCVFILFLADKFWYCRLSPNHKVLHYGDLEESPQGEVPHDNLQDKCK